MSANPGKCGFVCVIGLPNAGKSTLMNALVGTKVTIVSPKVQTTRMRVLGIALHGAAQIILLDTPGVFKPQKMLERAMVGAAWEALQESDAVMHLVDVSHKNPLQANQIIIEKLPKGRPAVLVLNKIDCVPKETLLDLSAQLNAQHDYAATYMISALKENGLKQLQDGLADILPEGPWHFEEDEITDMPARLMAAEITREKIFLQLHQELPYAAYVETEEWEEFDNGSVKIHQTITVQRDSQKAIVLGKGGSRIKKIGQHAREDIEELLGRKVHLKLFVKAQENWQDKPDIYRLMGLDQK